MTHTPAERQSWLESLLSEAERDLVFLWNIRNGSFGGGGVSPDDDTLESVVDGLVQGGCLVGFGDPSFPNWRLPPELQVAREELAKQVVRLWERDPENWQNITFAIRDAPSRARHDE